ncbi:hypothetical protein BHE74_00028587 [Ensete ventricosum]|nr:hypothetical protein BHE74_00028587 [Ensete ventricosum]
MCKVAWSPPVGSNYNGGGCPKITVIRRDHRRETVMRSRIPGGTITIRPYAPPLPLRDWAGEVGPAKDWSQSDGCEVEGTIGGYVSDHVFRARERARVCT